MEELPLEKRNFASWWNILQWPISFNKIMDKLSVCDRKKV